jgi:hypothetical protein
MPARRAISSVELPSPWAANSAMAASSTASRRSAAVSLIAVVVSCRPAFYLRTACARRGLLAWAERLCGCGGCAPGPGTSSRSSGATNDPSLATRRTATGEHSGSLHFADTEVFSLGTLALGWRPAVRVSRTNRYSTPMSNLVPSI